jgi:hypothetical protein
MVWRKKSEKISGISKNCSTWNNFLGRGGLGECGCRSGSRLRQVKSVKKVVRKYLILKGWDEGHLPKPMILQVVTYQILERKGLAGGHVCIIVNIFGSCLGAGSDWGDAWASKKCSTWNIFSKNCFFLFFRCELLAKDPTSAKRSRCGAPGPSDLRIARGTLRPIYF